MARHRDLSDAVSEDDYPTGEIDVWPLLAEDAPADAFAVEDARGQVHLHGKGTGRFVRKARRTVLRTLGTGDDARQMPIRIFTWDEVKRLSTGPETVDLDGPNVYEWPDEPGVEWETTTFAPGVTSCKPTHSDNHVKVNPPARKAVAATPAAIRSWARKNGIPVNESGRVPKAIVDAYNRANVTADR